MVEVSLELLGQEGGITINARPGGDAVFLPLGKRPFKQTNKCYHIQNISQAQQYNAQRL